MPAESDAVDWGPDPAVIIGKPGRLIVPATDTVWMCTSEWLRTERGEIANAAPAPYWI